MKTILFHPDRDRLKSIMTEAAGGFTQYVGLIERSVSQSEFVCVWESEKAPDGIVLWCVFLILLVWRQLSLLRPWNTYWQFHKIETSTAHAKQSEPNKVV